ncbi:hypothetical protein [Klebsiella sp. CVUAS 10975.2]|uniref:hypothetical protein n=1 Tax=Klebsiella sp. CVUAS 10975.2 TaxID=2109904 RepID=UPI001C7EDC40|nr:hypothetical protein [Klebsiella sp. CVUAS 10975.2]MBX4738581.1 hypothetical protein [Klebsiella sp. CVUAS 10975.2]
MTNNQLTDEQRVLAYVERLKAAATVYLDVSAKDVPFYDKAVARRPFDLLLHPSDLLILIASYEAKEAELQERRKAEKDSEPVADVVAWSHPTEERTCDIRWRRHDVEPGPLYRHAQQPVVPATLPCSVELKPGLIIGKGCKTETLLTALRRRADYNADIDAMTPEERAEHDASIKAFKAMLAAAPQEVPDGK